MKTKIISTLKHELLIIEHPEETYFEVFKHGILFKDHLSAEREFIEGSYTLLGKPEEIMEEDARELVESFGRGNLKRFKGYNKKQFEKTAKESILSLLESEIYWVNPLGKDEPAENLQSSTFGGEKTIIQRNPMNILWHKAQEKTFDRNRSIILKKNK